MNGPYAEESTNLIYQLLFCDQPELYRQKYLGDIQHPWSVLFAEEADAPALTAIAEDKHQESRVRMLACNRLRAAGLSVAPKQHLGTIIEVHLPEGLDTLAAFTDGGARYINHSGKMTIVEGDRGPFAAEIAGVIKASQPIVAAIGPWNKERLPPPPAGNIRMSFLVSDGLYFGEGPIDVMQQQAVAAPLIQAAMKLLLKVLEQATEN